MQRRAGFTLIEVLIVVAILAALTAILLPMLARARENTRGANCASNLKQLGLAFGQYVSDNDGHYPDSFNYTTPGGVSASWDVVLQPYLKSLQTLACSSDVASVRFDLPALGQNVYRSYGLTYNVAKASYDTTTHEARIPKPAETVLLAETDSTLGNRYNPATWQYGHYVVNLGADLAWRHNNTANFLWVDGHVKARNGKEKGPFPKIDGYAYVTSAGALCGAADPLPQ